MVTPLRRSTAHDVAGSNASTMIWRYPAMSPPMSQLIPPMCVTGNTSALRSSSVISNRRLSRSAAAPTVRSVCSVPLGCAVVPDV